jgi:CofD-related protein of GAK system
MNPIRITRTVKMPDPVRLSRYRKSPELGPRILFFTGGSALKNTSRVLKDYTHNSVHFVTPFDSGGSSAKLRKAFNMPSIGDLRSRLIALADENITGHPDVYKLFTYRLPHDKANDELLKQIDSMIRGKDSLISNISNPMRRLIRTQLGYFRDAMPTDFDLRGASVGNLILAGGYLNNHKHLDPIVFLFSKLVNVLGTVRTVVNSDIHLGAKLADGSLMLGQHNLTGKEVTPLRSPVKSLFLSEKFDQYIPVTVEIRKKNRKLIKKSELICYPPGSFYTSVLANLLPNGVTTAIAESDCPKIFIPNLGQDPEQLGMTLDDSVQTLLKYLKAGNEKNCPNEKLLNFILMDKDQSRYASKLTAKLIKNLGIQVCSTRLVSKQSDPYYDPKLLVAALLSLI